MPSNNAMNLTKSSRTDRGLRRLLQCSTGVRSVLRSLLLAAWIPAAFVVAAEPAPACSWSKVWHPSTEIPNATAPKQLKASPVKWPASTTKRKGGGMPIVEAVIDKTGNVVDARVVRPSRWQPPWPEFDQAALDSVLQWKYEPARVDGEPVQACLTVAINVHWR